MAMDPMSERFAKKQKQTKLDDLARKARSKEDVEAEEELVKNASKVEPIRADGVAGRNDPCPCGSGKKYKKCCGVNK